MTRLRFGTNNSIVGFTSLNTASFNDLPPARIIRELLQNSLDAASEAKVCPAVVRFRVDDLHQSEVPDIRGYEEAFRKAVEYQKEFKAGELSDGAGQVCERIENSLAKLKSGRMSCLTVLDNGIGLDNRRMTSLLGDGASIKSIVEAGSYGVGHLAPMALSDLRYILYGGVICDGGQIACGWTSLASHLGPNRLNSPNGYLIEGFGNGHEKRLYEFLSPENFPPLTSKRLDEIQEDWGHGSAFQILAYNHFGERNHKLWDIVAKVASYNFCTSIHRGELVIEVSEGNDEKELNTNSLRITLAQEKDKARASRADSFYAGLRPSGHHAYSTLTAITQAKRKMVKVSGGSIHISLLNLLEHKSQPRVDLFRNGMWITDDLPCLRKSDFTTHQPFHAVMEIDAEEGGALHRLIRKAEGPLHDKLSLRLLSEPEQRNLKGWLNEIADWIKKEAPKMNTESYTVDDFLVIRSDNTKEGGGSSFSYWGRPEPYFRRNVDQVTEGPEKAVVDPNKKKKRRSKKQRGPRRPSETHPLPIRAIAAPDGKGIVRMSFLSDVVIPEIWLALCVDDNRDATTNAIWQEENMIIKSLHIQGTDPEKEDPRLEILEDGRRAKILGLDSKTQYEARIECETPNELAETIRSPVYRVDFYHPPRHNYEET